jgi:nucleotide-binding universal stress UspA family protein
MYHDILLAVDLSEARPQAKAVETAVVLARSFSARLHVINVVPDFGSSMVGSFFPKDYEKTALEHADRALHGFVAEHVPEDIPVQHIVGHGSIYREIIHYAGRTGCDLIVMSSHRPELSEYLLGPNAARVVRHATQSVMVVRE